MLPPVPDVRDYGISPSRGFLPPDFPLARLPDTYYKPWESVIQNIQPLILSKRLRDVANRLPVLTTDHLKEEAEWRRAYVILAFLAHGYVWGGPTPEERVPPAISRPFKDVCQHLELPMVATYAGVCLWNWMPIFEDEQVDDLSNLGSLHTFTGSSDESWFYLVSVAIEARGGASIPIMLEAIEAARRDDNRTVASCLEIMAEQIDGVGALLNRMYEECSPDNFYHKIRPFLAGSSNMQEAGLPNGVLFDTGSGRDEFVQYGGGSNAQSSLIQFFDIVLGVEHRPTGVGKSDSFATGPTDAPPSHNFITEMRKYMPGAHRRFLYDVSAVANIREYVHAHGDDERLVLAYDACLAMLRALRDKHIQMVSRYIIVKSRESRSISPRQPAAKGRVNLANLRRENTNEAKKVPRGTGGTALIPFLKQARDETSEGVVDSWAKRLLGEMPVTSRPAHTSMKKKRAMTGGLSPDASEDELEFTGLAGKWEVDDSEGGICHW